MTIFILFLLDSASSIDEDRYQTIGTTRDGKALVVIHADDHTQEHQSDVEVIRIISARPLKSYERRLFENEKQPR